MIIAVSSQGQDLDSPLDPRFGRAGYFILYDTEQDNFKVLENQSSLNAAQGAGVQTAQAVWRHKAGAVITGHCGPKAFDALKAGGIPVYLCRVDTVREAVQAYTEGALEQAGEPDRTGHW